MARLEIVAHIESVRVVFRSTGPNRVFREIAGALAFARLPAHRRHTAITLMAGGTIAAPCAAGALEKLDGASAMTWRGWRRTASGHDVRARPNGIVMFGRNIET